MNKTQGHNNIDLSKITRFEIINHTRDITPEGSYLHREEIMPKLDYNQGIIESDGRVSFTPDIIIGGIGRNTIDPHYNYEFSVQDNGTTLKIFITNKEN